MPRIVAGTRLRERTFTAQSQTLCLFTGGGALCHTGTVAEFEGNFTAASVVAVRPAFRIAGTLPTWGLHFVESIMPAQPALRKRRRSHSNGSDSAVSTGNSTSDVQAHAQARSGHGVETQPEKPVSSGVLAAHSQAEVDAAKRRRTSSDAQAPASTATSVGSNGAVQRPAGAKAHKPAVKPTNSKAFSVADLSNLVPLKPSGEHHTPLLVATAKRDETPKPEPATVAAASKSAPSVWDASEDISPQNSPAKVPTAAVALAGSQASGVGAEITTLASASASASTASAADAALDSQIKRQHALLQRQKNVREALAEFVAGTVSCHVFHSNFPEPEWHPTLPAGVRLCDSGPGRTALAEGMRAAKIAANSSLVGLRRRDIVEDLASGRLLQAGLPTLEQRLPTPHLGGFPLPINNAPWATGPVARRQIRKAGIGVRAPEKGIGPRWWGIKPLADAPPDTPLAIKMGVAGKFLKPMSPQQQAAVGPSFSASTAPVPVPPPHHASRPPSATGPSAAAAAGAVYLPHQQLPQGFNGAGAAPVYFASAQMPQAAMQGGSQPGGGGHQYGSSNQYSGASYYTAPTHAAHGAHSAPASAQAPQQTPGLAAPGGGNAGAYPPQPAAAAALVYSGSTGFKGSAASRAPVTGDNSWRQRAAAAASSGSGSMPPARQAHQDTSTGAQRGYADAASSGRHRESDRGYYPDERRYDRGGAPSSSSYADDCGGYRGGYRGGGADYSRRDGQYRRDSYRGESQRSGSHRSDNRSYGDRGGGRSDRGGYYGSAARQDGNYGSAARSGAPHASQERVAASAQYRPVSTGGAAQSAAPAGAPASMPRLVDTATAHAVAPQAASTAGARSSSQTGRVGQSTRLKVGRGPRGGSLGHRR